MPHPDHSPTISVIMPAYNAADYIESAIKSILCQTYENFELIVINDGSTDDTESIVTKLANDDSRIFVINQPNLGIVESLNRGLKISRGTYIARMDADDISLPTRFQRQLNEFSTNPRLIACGTWFQKIDNCGKKLSSFFNPPITNKHCKQYLLLKNCFAHPSIMLRRNIPSCKLEYNHDYVYAEDYKLWSDIQEHGDFYNIPEKLLLYRVHRNQISAQKLAMQQAVHSTIATENLNSQGISITRKELSQLLWSKKELNFLLTLAISFKSIKAGIWTRYSPAAQACWILLKKIL